MIPPGQQQPVSPTSARRRKSPPPGNRNKKDASAGKGNECQGHGGNLGISGGGVSKKIVTVGGSNRPEGRENAGSRGGKSRTAQSQSECNEVSRGFFQGGVASKTARITGTESGLGGEALTALGVQPDSLAFAESYGIG